MADVTRVTDDGLPSRESGIWAEEKLYYLSRYFYAFNQATKGTFTKRVYVDLMAGPGHCHLRGQRDYRFMGSPLLAATCSAPFTSMLCIESHADSAAALSQRLAAAVPRDFPVEVHTGDCNSPESIDKARAALAGPKTLGLIFVDTLGLGDVHFETLAAITRDRRADLIYTFHVQDVTRNIDEALNAPDEWQRFTRSFGTSDWAMAWEAHAQGLIGTSTPAEALTLFFEMRLTEGLGYTHTTSLHLLMKNSKNAPLYRLVLAAHDSLAPELWRKISAIEADGQRGLF